MGDLTILDHYRPRPAALAAQAERAVTLCGDHGDAAGGRIVAAADFRMGETVAFTRGGRTRRAVICGFICPPGEHARARLMVAPGYFGAGSITSAGLHQLEPIHG